MKRLILICFLVVFIGAVSGLCEEGDIDINSASLTELDKIVYIGQDRAQQIIDIRPFTSLDGLIEVSGIANKTLEAIKDEGLACVNGYEEKPPVEEPPVEEEPENKVVEINGKIIKELVEEKGVEEKQTQTITPEIIRLNSPKDIKSEEDKKVLDKTDYAKYGFIAFCILIGILLILKNKKKQKNEII